MTLRWLSALVLSGITWGAGAQVGGSSGQPPVTPITPGTLPPSTGTIPPHLKLNPRQRGPVCRVRPTVAQAFISAPKDIDADPYRTYIPQLAKGKITQAGSNIDIHFPYMGFNAIWMHLKDAAESAPPFNELFLYMTADDLAARNLVSVSRGTNLTCYVRVLIPSLPTYHRVLPLRRYVNGPSSSEATDYSILGGLQFGSYSYDVEIYTFTENAAGSATTHSMNKVQSYSINFKHCNLTAADSCP